MTTYIDASLAWDLVDYCQQTMRKARLKKTYVPLGAGDYYNAITFTLVAAKCAELRFPTELSSRLDEWCQAIPDIERRQPVVELIAALGETPA